MGDSHDEYQVFISYRHVEPDRKWAKWLHRALETYRVPKHLVKQGVDARIPRVFRDEEELAASADLSREIDEALRRSQYLVVVCSPRTPPSQWVNEEIVRFRELGRGDRILALLIEGEPSEAFPAALRQIRKTIVDSTEAKNIELATVEPLAADARPESYGSTRQRRSLSKLRILATVLGCRFDDLKQREHERHIRQMAAAFVATLMLMLVMAGLSLFAVYQRALAEQALARFKAEQIKRQQDRKKSAPEIARSSKVLVEHDDLAKAETLIRTAIDYAPDLGEAHLAYALLRIHAGDYPTALAEARLALACAPGDADAESAIRLCRQLVAHGPDAKWMGRAAALARRQGMPTLAAKFAESVDMRLALYREKIEQTWPGRSERLTVDAYGRFGLDLSGCLEVHRLTALRGMDLTWLNLSECEGVDNLKALANMELQRLELGKTSVKDLRSLRNMPLTYLDLSETDIHDLGPLQGLPLETLRLKDSTRLSDLGPLHGMPLRDLQLINCYGIKNLSPLAGMPLRRLILLGCKVADLSPLKGMPLETLNIYGCSVADLSPLEGMPLETLDIFHTLVSDISPLSSTKLRVFSMGGSTVVQDISPLQDLPLRDLNVDNYQVLDVRPLKALHLVNLRFNTERVLYGIDEIRNMASLRSINRKPVEKFWKEYDRGDRKLSLANREIADLSPLKGLNITRLDLYNTNPSNLEPLKGLSLEELRLTYCRRIKDLTPLNGMPLKSLELAGCRRVHDLSPLRSMPLRKLNVHRCAVSKLDALTGMPLVELNAYGTGITNLTPVADAPLAKLNIAETPITDLSPLTNMPLVDLTFDAAFIRNLYGVHEILAPLLNNTVVSGVNRKHSNISEVIHALRNMGSLKTINSKDAAVFWKTFDEAVDQSGEER